MSIQFLAPNMELTTDLKALLSEQRRELTAAQAVESDLLFAFQLQMQEAMKAFLSQNSDAPSSSNSAIFEGDAVSETASESTAAILSEEISRYEQQLRDHEAAEAEMKEIRFDLNRRIHDQAFAREILNLSREEWERNGDNFEKSYNGGSALARGVGVNNKDSFRVYVKGLIREKLVGDEKRKILLAGIGIAICDMNDALVLEVSKGVVGSEMGHEVVEVKALIEGLNTAIMLGLKRVLIVSDSDFLYQCVTGKWRPRESNLAALVDQFTVLQRKLTFCNLSLVGERDFKFAFKLTHNAIVSQAERPLQNSGGKNIVVTCAICLENINADDMFIIYGCSHRHCFSCMKRHVEVKLLQSLLPKCPHDGCKFKLKIVYCEKFLTPELLDIMNQRIAEASIPPTEKIYCPYPTCSALMSRSESETQGASKETITFSRMCRKCHRRFCINCKVPWHDNMNCQAYQLNPYPCPEDGKLKSLATKNLWRQCVNCNHMVSLAEGCNHIYCRFTPEFCALCLYDKCLFFKCFADPAKWKNKKASCTCPLWDEQRILYDDPNPH